MQRAVIALALALAFAISGWGGFSPAVFAQTQDSSTEAEDWGGLPPGEGREEVFYTCQACHSLKTVLQQRLSKDVWDETLEWMIDEQGMPEPEADEYALILNYLGTRLAP